MPGLVRRLMRMGRSCSGLLPVLLLLLLTSTTRGALGASDRVKRILSNMTLEEKIGQMAQLDISIAIDWANMGMDRDKVRYFIRDWKLGSFLNSPYAGDGKGTPYSWTAQQWRRAMRVIQEVAQEEGVVPLLHGLDSVHGANYVEGATIFPHQHGLGATFEPIHAYHTGKAAAQDTMAAGIQWIFGPILDLGTSPRWPRMYETFSEDPVLTSAMGVAAIQGIQNFTAGSKHNMRSAACMKHFIAYGGSMTGQDQSPVLLDRRDVMNYYLPPYRAAVKAGVRTAMESYQEISGVPMVSSSEYLDGLLRREIGFEGMLVTDYGEIEALHGLHAVAADNKESVRIAMSDTSIDMSMVAWSTDFMQDLKSLVESGAVPMSRIDDSVTRVLELKEWTGVLDQPMELVQDDSPLDAMLGSQEDRNNALNAVRESVTLLKNDMSTLPLPSDKPLHILVTGPSANSLTYQSGGWTVHWHGPAGDYEFKYGQTVLQGIKATAASGSVITHLPGIDIEGKPDGDRQHLLDTAHQADVIVAVIGEKPYAEEAGNIKDLYLGWDMESFISSLADTGVPLVTILLEGRPRLLGSIPTSSSAVLHAFLPGPAGGGPIGEILFGITNPSGRMPFTYPRHQNFPLQYYHKVRQWDYDVEWAFGEGMSFTSFEYSNIKVSPATADESTPVSVSVIVTNTGARQGKHSVLLFVTDVVRRVTPEYKLLKAFTKVDLQPGHATTVNFTLVPSEDLSYYGVDRRRVVEGGDFLLSIGPQPDCRKDPGPCAKLKVEVSSRYSPVCEAACGVWDYIRDRGGCAAQIEQRLLFPDRSSCEARCRSQDWTWSYVDCLEETLRGRRCDFHHRCRNVFL